MPMSISIPPLLFGFAYSRLGRNGSREVALNTSGVPIRPPAICFFAAAYPASKRRMNPIWKNMPDAAIAVCIAATSSSASAGGFSQKVGFRRLPPPQKEPRSLFGRLAAARRRDDELAMRMRRADDDDRVNRGIVDERCRIGVVLRHVAFGRDFVRERGHWIGNRDQPRLRNPACQIARVHPAEPAEADQTDIETFHLALSLVTSSSFTLMSAGIFSPRITFTALSIAARPISAGNCATEAAIVPSAIAFFASSSASKPTTLIEPVRCAAEIASSAPSAIRSLHAKTLSMSGCACSMFWNTLKP